MAYKDPARAKAYGAMHAKKHAVKREARARELSLSRQIQAAGRPPPEHCELCTRPASKEHHGRLHFDHDHATGKFRGWLCTRCNTGLGLFSDSPEILIRAAEYVLKSRGGQTC